MRSLFAMAKSVVRITGLVLLALTWLPSSFLARLEANQNSPSSQIRERISVEAAFVVPDPSLETQLHQFRLAGFQNSFAKKSGIDFFGTGCPYSRWDFQPAASQLFPLAPFDLLTTWQFSRRTALHPRAPCLVYLFLFGFVAPRRGSPAGFTALCGESSFCFMKTKF